MRFLSSTKHGIAAGFLTCMLLWIGLVFVQEMALRKSVAETKASGLWRIRSAPLALYSKQVYRDEVEVGWDKASLWRQQSLMPRLASFSPDDADKVRSPIVAAEDLSAKIVRKAGLQVFADSPMKAADDFEAVTHRLGGYMVDVTRNADVGGSTAVNMQVRVPAERLDAALAALRKLVVRVDAEEVKASDVTKEYVDMRASLRNLGAQEEQYRSILHNAKSIGEVMQVTEKLDGVRAEIEKVTGELKYLENDIAMSSISVAFRAEAETRIAGIHWKPWYQIKVSFRDGMIAVADYSTAMIAILFRLPAILLWLLTAILASIWGYRFARWMWRKLMPPATA